MLLLTAGVLPSLSAPVAADQVVANAFSFVGSQWGTSTSPVEAGPGSQNVPLVVTEQYFFSNTATGISATLTLPSGFTSQSGGQSSTAYVGASVASGTVVSFTFNLNIASDVPVGNYSFPMTINWGYTVSSTSVALVQYSSVPVPLKGKVGLSFSASTNSINPGNTITVPITVTNTGTGTATQLTFTTSAGSGASVNTAPFKLPQLDSGSSVTFNVGLVVPFSLQGSALTLTVLSTYYDAYGVLQSPAGQTIGLFVNNPTALSPVSITVTPSTMAAGQTNVLSFAMTNTGSYDITNLAATFASSSQQGTATSSGSVVTSGATQVTLLNPSLFQLATLGSGSTSTAAIQIFVGDSVVGSVSVTLTLSYYVGTISKTETRNYGFIVTPDTSASFSPLAIVVTPTTLLQGSYTNMTISITNTFKSTPIVAVSVTPTISATGVTILGPGIFQQTSLPGNSTMTVPLQVYAPPTAPSAGQLSVVLSYYVNNVLKTETRIIGILFRGNIDLELTGTTVTPTVFTPGSAGSITLTITNLGATAASAVTASAQLPTGFTAFGTTSSLIGDMAVDNPTTFSVSMTISNGTTGGRHVVPFTLTYLDNLRTRTSKVVDVTVNVLGPGGAGGNFTGRGGGTFTRTGVGGSTNPTRSAIEKYLPFPYLEVVIGLIALGLGMLAGRRFSRKS